jgi:hypothetical protein
MGTKTIVLDYDGAIKLVYPEMYGVFSTQGEVGEDYVKFLYNAN